MTIQQVFNIYKEDNWAFNYCPYGDAIDKFFIDYKENFVGFQYEDIALIKSFLSHNEDRWFVFHLLNVVHKLYEELFEPLMTSILSFGCDGWRHSTTYDNMARIFGFEKVELYLQNEFVNSYSDIYKRSIVEAMWRNSYSIPYVIPDEDLDCITVFKYIWKDNRYQFLEFISESQDEAKFMFNKQDILIQNRYKLLLEHFLYYNISPEFFHDCSVVLPRKRSVYKNTNERLFDQLVEKLTDVKNNSKSNFSLYLKNPVNHWDWI